MGMRGRHPLVKPSKADVYESNWVLETIFGCCWMSEWVILSNLRVAGTVKDIQPDRQETESY